MVSYRAKDFSADPKAVEDVKQHGQEMVFYGVLWCVVVCVVPCDNLVIRKPYDTWIQTEITSFVVVVVVVVAVAVVVALAVAVAADAALLVEAPAVGG